MLRMVQNTSGTVGALLVDVRPNKEHGNQGEQNENHNGDFDERHSWF